MVARDPDEVFPGTREMRPCRLIQVTDVDRYGRRWPVLVTGDRHVVTAVERAVEERVAYCLGDDPVLSDPRGAES